MQHTTEALQSAFLESGSAAATVADSVSITIDQVALNTMWVGICGALVFFMQAGFALLEAGLVRSKNTINVVMKNFMDMSVGAVAFWMFGFAIMFGTIPSGWFGQSHFALHNGEAWDYTFLFFQMMFAATAATIVSGSCAERVRFVPYLFATVIITSFIYTVFGSWAWGGSYTNDGHEGWLKARKFIDFAGSSVVHSVGGWCALAGVIVLGPRLGRFASDGTPRNIDGHNLPLAALGVLILWLGWFGFNAGSTLEVSANIGKILLNTHLSGSGGAAAALITMAVLRQPVLMTTTINGALGGMVGITAGCATMEPGFALLTGVIAGALVVFTVNVMERLQWDDPVSAVAVHGVGGAWCRRCMGNPGCGHFP